ncbi:hypothetical protein PS624_05425 [Pseudomonas fluorescens]|uniref:Uncharacterized protein n=1 Tax=Pseudomonas fluorescens TaxID=294 RepID=A0A5E6XJW1_PSEFL|nr:hypothetical protein PS624_05425 [Pseudomonas fluorescens]
MEALALASIFFRSADFTVESVKPSVSSSFFLYCAPISSRRHNWTNAEMLSLALIDGRASNWPVEEGRVV